MTDRRADDRTRQVAAEAAEPTTATGGEKEEEDPRENRPIRTDLGY